MNSNRPNDIVIDLKVFCLNCGIPLPSATYEDMNGDFEHCPSCGPEQKTSVGLSVHCDSKKLLIHAYQEMQRNISIVKKLLSERQRPAD